MNSNILVVHQMIRNYTLQYFDLNLEVVTALVSLLIHINVY
jgi:hypothetical protein